MLKHTQIYLILVLTFFQSSIAMGDIDQLRPFATDNISLTIALNTLNKIEQLDTNIDLIEQEHDCSLCHGHGCFVLPVITLSFMPGKTRTPIPEYYEKNSSEIPDLLQRPPISRS